MVICETNPSIPTVATSACSKSPTFIFTVAIEAVDTYVPPAAMDGRVVALAKIDAPRTLRSNPTDAVETTNRVSAATHLRVTGLGDIKSPPIHVVGPEYTPDPTKTGDMGIPVIDAEETSSRVPICITDMETGEGIALR